jgi:Mg/Co/Ni transporter MgtE
MNGLWKKLWPEVCGHLEDYEEETVIHKIVELTSEAGLEGVNEDDVEELLQSHGESLINDELREISERSIQCEFTASDAEECENILQNSSAKASPRSSKSWTSS